MKMDVGRDYSIASVKRALTVLKAFQCESYGDSKALTLMELCEQTHISPSTMTRILYSLCEEDFLDYDRSTKKYKLSVLVFRLGMSMYNSINLNEVAQPYLRQLADECGLVVYLAVTEDDAVVVVDRMFPNLPTNTWPQMMARAGYVLPMHTSGISRLFLSQFPDEEIRARLSRIPLTRFTSHTRTDIDEIIEVIHQIRREGLAYCDCENEEYIGSICAPIRDHNNRIVAGISLGGIRDIIYGPRLDEYKIRVMSIAHLISTRIGGH